MKFSPTGETDGQAEITKLLGAFGIYTKVPNSSVLSHWLS